MNMSAMLRGSQIVDLPARDRRKKEHHLFRDLQEHHARLLRLLYLFLVSRLLASASQYTQSGAEIKARISASHLWYQEGV
jgi:hypothetical protein